MLAIGRALMARPRLLLMDEPSMGLAPALVDQVFDIIQTINSQGTTILVVEQNAAVALSIAHRGYVLQNGSHRSARRRRRIAEDRFHPARLPGRGLTVSDILSILPQQLVFGIALGTVYGLLALGYTMVYGVLFMINFAHGEIFMIGAYIGWGLLTILLDAQLGGLHPLWVLPVLLLPAMLFSGGLGVALERFAYRPLYARGATRLGPLISAVGASIFLQNAVMLTQGARMKVYMTNFLFPPTWRFNLFGASISALLVVMVGVATAMMWGLNTLVQRTRLGRAIRAVAEDREMAAAMGVDVGKVISATFFLGSALAGAAGVLIGLYYTQIDFVMGYSAGLKAFTAAVLGGIGNIRGAMLGGLLLGVIESLAVSFINPAFKDVVVFAVLILTLVFRPEGLLGERLRRLEESVRRTDADCVDDCGRRGRIGRALACTQ